MDQLYSHKKKKLFVIFIFYKWLDLSYSDNFFQIKNNILKSFK